MYEFRELISHGRPTVDDVASLFLETFCTYYDTSYLCPQFLPLLRSETWTHVKRFFVSNQHPQRSVTRPKMSGESSIAIPCFVHGNHWTGLVRREIDNQVIFLYADDLNCLATESCIQNMLSRHTNTSFYPPSARWIRCKNFTYTPHSNECGPRMLLALSIMATHPAPTEFILLPYMHSNIAQIARLWVAKTIITGVVQLPNLEASTTMVEVPISTTHFSEASDLICWQSQNDSTTNKGASTKSTHVNSPHPSGTTNKHTDGNQVLRPSRQNRLKTLGDFLRPTTTRPLKNRQSTASTGKIKHFKRIPLVKIRPKNNILTGITPSLSGFRKITTYFKPIQCADHGSVHFSIHTTANSTPSLVPSVQVAVTPNTTCFIKKKNGSKTTNLTNQSSRPPTLKCNPHLRITQFLDETTHSCPTDTTWGHQLCSIDSSDTLRIVLQNPNGIKLNPLDMGEFEHSLRICHSMGAGIISLSESNVNWNHTYLLGRVHQAVRKVWQTTAIQHSQHPEPYHQQCQRGGTLQIATDCWVSRLQSKGLDPYGLGRWSYMILKGKGERSIAIITAYRVCKSTFDSAGDTTSYLQQFRTLLAHYNSVNRQATPDPHRQFVLDLQAWITMLR